MNKKFNKWKMVGVVAAVMMVIFGSLQNMGRSVKYAFKKVWE
jgi:hypothetical protein